MKVASKGSSVEDVLELAHRVVALRRDDRFTLKADSLASRLARAEGSCTNFGR